jgi:hypothetical protein
MYINWKSVFPLCYILLKSEHVTFDLQGRYFGPSPVPRDGDPQAVGSSFQCSRSASGSTYCNSSTSHSDVSYSQNYFADVLGTVKQECFQPLYSCSTGKLEMINVSSDFLEVTTL